VPNVLQAWVATSITYIICDGKNFLANWLMNLKAEGPMWIAGCNAPLIRFLILALYILVFLFISYVSPLIPFYFTFFLLILWWGAGVVICLEQGADLHMAQLMPLPLTVSCFSKIQIGFTFLIPAHLGSPGQRAVKQECVCVTGRSNQEL